MYEYKCTIVRVVDGDTVDVDIDLGFGVWVKNERVRIVGIDTPESRTRDRVEKLFGLAAKERTAKLLSGNCILRTQIDRNGKDAKGKFGRILGDFIIEKDGQERMLTDVLVEEGHAVRYFGGSKEEVEAKHIENRQKILNEGLVDRAEYERLKQI